MNSDPIKRAREMLVIMGAKYYKNRGFLAGKYWYGIWKYLSELAQLNQDIKYHNKNENIDRSQYCYDGLIIRDIVLKSQNCNYVLEHTKFELLNLTDLVIISKLIKYFKMYYALFN